MKPKGEITQNYNIVNDMYSTLECSDGLEPFIPKDTSKVELHQHASISS